MLKPGDKKDIFDKAKPFQESYSFHIVSSLGWRGGAYISPTAVFGAPSSGFERDFGDLDLSKYRCSGSLQKWQDNVLVLCTGNSRLMFALMCAFAGPLLNILGISSFGFQLFDPVSSIGKTIIQTVAGSVWGCRVGSSASRGFLESWATTLEGVECDPAWKIDPDRGVIGVQL